MPKQPGPFPSVVEVRGGADRERTYGLLREDREPLATGGSGGAS